jgi:hypothetical protein
MAFDSNIKRARLKGSPLIERGEKYGVDSIITKGD